MRHGPFYFTVYKSNGDLNALRLKYFAFREHPPALWSLCGANFGKTSRISMFSIHNNIKPTKDDERQLQPDDRQSVEQEGSDDASNITKRGADRHAEIPTHKRTTSKRLPPDTLMSGGKSKILDYTQTGHFHITSCPHSNNKGQQELQRK